MKYGMEQMLKLVADFEAFCTSGSEDEEALDGDELDAQALDLIAAAGTIPSHTEQEPSPKQ